MKKIIVPAEITRDWLKEFAALVRGASPMETAKNRMALIREGKLTQEDAARIREAKAIFEAKARDASDKKYGDMKAAKRIAKIEGAIKAIPQVSEIVGKWGGKVYDRRFIKAIDAIEGLDEEGRWTKHRGVIADDRGSSLEIRFLYEEYGHNALLAWVPMEEMLTDEPGNKRPRINAAAILARLETGKAELEKEIETIKEAQAAVQKVRELLKQYREVKAEITKYDRETLIDYGLSKYDLDVVARF